VVVGDLDIVRIAGVPPETDAPLVIDPNAVLARSVAHQLLQPVARRDPEVGEFHGGVQLPQLPQGDPLQGDRQTPYGLPVEQASRIPVTEASDHRGIVTRRVIMRKS
jgi:hypothetical protein